MFQEENEQKIKELKETRMDLEAQFNKFKYSDADEAAKIDNDLFEMTQKTKENNKLANEYRTKLERQNSKPLFSISTLKIQSRAASQRQIRRPASLRQT